jgi:hypothetical protein
MENKITGLIKVCRDAFPIQKTDAGLRRHVTKVKNSCYIPDSRAMLKPATVFAACLLSIMAMTIV